MCDCFYENQWVSCVCVCVAACNSMGDIAGQRKEMNEQFGGVERDGGGEKVS